MEQAQSNCNADPFCAECEQGLKLCIKCLASKNRVIKLPESICVCMDGYYPDANNTCVPCKSGCGICKSATNCTSCVALSTPLNDGSCTCPDKTFFKVSLDGVRYCAACGANCIKWRWLNRRDGSLAWRKCDRGDCGVLVQICRRRRVAR